MVISFYESPSFLSVYTFLCESVPFSHRVIVKVNNNTGLCLYVEGVQ